MEHPVDPGRDPYPSVFDTSFFQSFEAASGMKRWSFPQCMVGAVAKKMTTTTATQDMDLSAFPTRCTHTSHEIILGLNADVQTFKTRAAQSYPPTMCQLLAEAFIAAFELKELQAEMVMDQAQVEQKDEEETQMTLGQRIPSPEVANCWDPIDRWRESGRWTWGFAEHNNLLEGRAGVAAAAIMVQPREAHGKRIMMFSDSQVVVGAFAKGRSSVRAINHLCRKIASMTLGLGVRFSWRYMRTHRNHSDGPSRGFPLGVAPPSAPEDRKSKKMSWQVIPDIFYKRTSG